MTQRNKTILWAAIFGAVVGAAVASRAGHSLLSLPALASDRPLIAHPFFVIACIAWVLFSVYWDYAAKRAAAAKSSESQDSRRVHVWLANVALLLEIAPIHGLGRFLPVASS